MAIGTLELTVTETIVGEPSEVLEIRLKRQASATFIGDFVSEDPQAVWWIADPLSIAETRGPTLTA